MDMDKPVVGGFQFDHQTFSLQDIYRVLGFSTPPTDRELEAKIIMYMRKYNGYNSDSDDRRLYDFFNQLYDHLFDTEEEEEGQGAGIVEGFVVQSSPVVSQLLASASARGSVPASASATGSVSVDISAGSAGSAAGAAGSAGSAAGAAGSAGAESTVAKVNTVPYSRDVLNPILKQTIQRIISIDSRYRNLNNISSNINRLSTNFTIELSEPLRDVLSLKLYSYQIPYTWYTINRDYGSNFFIIRGRVAGLSESADSEYMVEITPGNYSATELTTAINTSLDGLASKYPDVSFGNTKLTYDNHTTVATFQMDIQKTYQEPQYFLDWNKWASPWIGIDREGSGARISNIPQYLGFDNQTYDPCSIYSVRDVFPKSSYDEQNDQNISVYYVKTGEGGDISNNYFKIIQYIPEFNTNGSVSVNSYADISNNINSLGSLVKKEIMITLNLPKGGHTRKELMNEINLQILENPSFLYDGSDSLERLDQTDGLNSFFKMSLVLDRKNVPFYNSSKTVVVFPDESAAFTTGFFPIWTGSESCFQFDPSFVEFNDVVAEYPLFPANYIITGIPRIQLNVTTPGYIGYKLEFDVSSSTALGYTYDEYKKAINDALEKNNVTFTYNKVDVSTNIGSLTFVNNKFDFDETTSLPSFTFDFNYTLRTQDYNYVEFIKDLSLNNVSFNDLIQNDIPPNATSGTSGTTTGYTSYNLSTVSTAGAFSFSLKKIPIESAYKFYIPDPETILLKIHPIQTGDTSFEIKFQPTVGILNTSGSYYSYSNIDAFVKDLLTSITNYDRGGKKYPLRLSTVTKSADPEVYDDNRSYEKIDINLVINHTLTQKDCLLNLYDISGTETTYYTDNSGTYLNGSPYSSWGTYLNFVAPYDLSGSPIVQGTKPIQASTSVTLDSTNHYFYFRPQKYADGLYTMMDSNSVAGMQENDIRVYVKTGVYSVNSLFDALNTAFSEKEITRGTHISSFSKTINGISKSYCRLRVNINRSFYASDYDLVFYDLNRFVKCYVGSTSVRNTTWDSTIGWILGFHEKTVYELSEYSGFTGSVVSKVIDISGELSVNTNLFSYFLISVDDFNQNRLNDGLVTITRQEQQVKLPSYSAVADFTVDFSGNVGTSGSNLVAENNLTANQVYAINQTLEARKNTSKAFSQGPFVKDIFGYIPIKLPSKTGDIITEFGGSLQNQDRLYFGPVNIRRLQVQLINDKGTIMDLNGADWSFSFICEQLYQKKVG